MSQQALQTVDFHGTEHALLDINGQPYVAMRPVVEAIGLSWAGQFERIKRDDVLGATVVVTRTVGADGKSRELACLPLDMLNGWLFGVSVRRVKPELRDTLIAYKRECYAVLHQHWRHVHEQPARKPAGWARRSDADNVVDAGRCFSAYLRVSRAMGIGGVPAALKANATAADRTGVDLLADLGYDAQALAAALPEPPATPGQDPAVLQFLQDWQAVRVRGPAGRRLPFCPCTGSQLHTAFLGWCEGHGHPPGTIRALVGTIRRQPGWQAGQSHTTYLTAHCETIRSRKMVVPPQHAVQQAMMDNPDAYDGMKYPHVYRTKAHWLTASYFAFAEALGE